MIRSLSAANLAEIFTTPEYKGNYHPLTTLSWAVEYTLFGAEPLVYHLDNLILHLVNSILVLGLIHLITGKPWVAVVTALLFAVHPLRVESVAWISERKGLLSSLFFIASLIGYVRYVKNDDKGAYAAAIGLFVLSLLAKSTAVSLSLALILFDVVLRRRLDRRALYDKIPFFALSAIFGVVAIRAQEMSGSIHAGFSVASKVTLASESLLFYLGKSLVPLRLSAIYPYSGSGSWLHLVAVLGLAALVALSWKYTRKIVFGFGFFFVNIIFLLQIVAVGKFPAADRYTYLPLIGLFYLVGEGFAALLRKATDLPSRGYRAALYAGLGVLIAASSALTWQRTVVWRDSVSLMNDVIDQYPKEAQGHINRAMAIAATDPEGALEDYTLAIRYSPFRAVSFNNRGLLFYSAVNSTALWPTTIGGSRSHRTTPALREPRQLLLVPKAGLRAGAG